MICNWEGGDVCICLVFVCFWQVWNFVASGHLTIFDASHANCALFSTYFNLVQGTKRSCSFARTKALSLRFGSLQAWCTFIKQRRNHFRAQLRNLFRASRILRWLEPCSLNFGRIQTTIDFVNFGCWFRDTNRIYIKSIDVALVDLKLVPELWLICRLRHRHICLRWLIWAPPLNRLLFSLNALVNNYICCKILVVIDFI